MDVAAKAFTAIRQADMLAPGGRVVAAVSGGADSVVLLHVLLSLRDKLGLREVMAVHVHHGIRAEEAERDEAFVRLLCRDWAVPLRVVQKDVPALSREWKKGLEEAGREVRYAVFEELSAAHGGCPVATAHTLSDQAETLLLHLSRGCGPHGLTGIPETRGHIIRPLLTCSRQEIEAYCRENQLTYVSDSTNADVRYARNRIRGRVVPELALLNPQFEEAVGRLVRRMREVDHLLISLACEALSGAALAPDTYDRATLLALDPAVKAEALRLAAARAGSSCEERHIAELEDRLQESGSLSLPGNRLAVVSGDTLRFLTEPEEKPDVWGPIPISPGQNVRIMDRKVRVFCLSLEDWEKDRKIHKKLLKTSLDYDKICGSLRMRAREPGDAYHPVGRGGGKTLKKLLNEAHVPPEDRNRIPVLCDDKGILLVPGFGCDIRAAVDQNTRRILVAEVEKDAG